MVYIIAEVAATDRYQGARGVSLLAQDSSMLPQHAIHFYRQ